MKEIECQSETLNSLPQTLAGSHDSSMIHSQQRKSLQQVEIFTVLADQLQKQRQKEANKSQNDIKTANMLRLAKLKFIHGSSDEISSVMKFVNAIQQNGNYHLLVAVRRLIKQCEQGQVEKAFIEDRIRQMMNENLV